MPLKSTRLKNTLIRLVFSMVPRESKLLPYACFVASSLVTRSSISWRDAVVVDGGADVLAGGDEVRTLFEGYFGGDLGGARGCRCEFTMQGIVDVEEGNGQLEHELVEVTSAPLTARLHSGYTAARGLAIEDCCQVLRLPLAGGDPIQRMFQHCLPLTENNGGRQCSGGGTKHPH